MKNQVNGNQDCSFWEDFAPLWLLWLYWVCMILLLIYFLIVRKFSIEESFFKKYGGILDFLDSKILAIISTSMLVLLHYQQILIFLMYSLHLFKSIPIFWNYFLDVFQKWFSTLNVLCVWKFYMLKCNAQVCKVQLFWEGHKNLHNLPHGFEIYLVNVKTMRKIAQIFVTFSEKLNFT